MCLEAGLHACVRLTGGFPVHLLGSPWVLVPQVLVLLLQWHPVWQSSTTICRSSPGECSEKKIFNGGCYIFTLFGVKENISPGLDKLRKHSVTRLAAGFHLFTASICWAKLANYGFYWTKLSLFLVQIGWDDLIRLLHKSSLLWNSGAFYLLNCPLAKLGGIFLGCQQQTLQLWCQLAILC